MEKTSHRIRVTWGELSCVVHIPVTCNTPNRILDAVRTHPLLNKYCWPIHDNLYYAALGWRE